MPHLELVLVDGGLLSSKPIMLRHCTKSGGDHGEERAGSVHESSKSVGATQNPPRTENSLEKPHRGDREPHCLRMPSVKRRPLRWPYETKGGVDDECYDDRQSDKICVGNQ